LKRVLVLEVFDMMQGISFDEIVETRKMKVAQVKKIIMFSIVFNIMFNIVFYYYKLLSICNFFFVHVFLCCHSVYLQHFI
jgi:hypothetical protein